MSGKFSFGIYPLSAAGTPFGLATGPADDYKKVKAALADLNNGTARLAPRVYLIYTPEWEKKMFALADRYRAAGLLGDLTIGCGNWTELQENFALEHWYAFIRKIIERYHASLCSLQITNEPNLSFMEGSKPYILQALTEGVLTAKQECRKRGFSIPVGFGSVPDGPAAVPDFWNQLSGVKAPFQDAVDFVGHNVYVDVFEERPLDLPEISAAAERALRELRNNLKTAGFTDNVPIRITENGWPTGKHPFTKLERSYQRQSQVLEKVIRTIYSLRIQYHVSQYTLFGLRDADTHKDDLFHQYGILRDDYSPKPAYALYKKLIQELM
ncbi:hypothetical protein OYT88_13795 [Sporolactobacillus sp. CQH2019]|uniref:hypothetical protein n=1 Tax=Sporolactobacillus sp. CQH2019 TaxID=3023512 RepID=UPI0023682E82|nr:hypothetical protein [Sporolactobacillus sp. CQH2019]MDD9149621.1 hypothetical protein [Sporolactobacillus sp. CQH2019]